MYDEIRKEARTLNIVTVLVKVLPMVLPRNPAKIPPIKGVTKAKTLN